MPILHFLALWKHLTSVTSRKNVIMILRRFSCIRWANVVLCHGSCDATARHDWIRDLFSSACSMANRSPVWEKPNLIADNISRLESFICLQWSRAVLLHLKVQWLLLYNRTLWEPNNSLAKVFSTICNTCAISTGIPGGLTSVFKKNWTNSHNPGQRKL